MTLDVYTHLREMERPDVAKKINVIYVEFEKGKYGNSDCDFD
jgi:hypothetical protein